MSGHIPDDADIIPEDCEPEIGPAILDDIPQLADLLSLLFTHEADFQPDRAKQTRGLRLIMETPSAGRIFVARAGKDIAGMLTLLFAISTAEGGPVVLLEDMIIRPAFRDKGLGSRLLAHAVDFARGHGFLRITLLTDRVNRDAVRFYRRHGFSLSNMVPMRLTLPLDEEERN